MPFQELTESSYNLLMEKLKEFENCSYKMGDRVVKVNAEPGDVHLNGDTGKLIGGMCIEGIESYYVQWDNDVIPIFTMGEKLKLI